MRGRGVGEGFDEKIIDDLTGLFALAAVDPEYFEEERLVVGEWRFEPVDSM